MNLFLTHGWDSKKEWELLKKLKQSKSWEPVQWQPWGGEWASEGEELGARPRQGQHTTEPAKGLKLQWDWKTTYQPSEKLSFSLPGHITVKLENTQRQQEKSWK